MANQDVLCVVLLRVTEKDSLRSFPVKHLPLTSVFPTGSSGHFPSAPAASPFRRQSVRPAESGMPPSENNPSLRLVSLSRVSVRSRRKNAVYENISVQFILTQDSLRRKPSGRSQSAVSFVSPKDFSWNISTF